MENLVFVIFLCIYALIGIYTAVMVFYYCQKGSAGGKSFPVLGLTHVCAAFFTGLYFLLSNGFGFAFASVVFYVTIMFLFGMLGFIIFAIYDYVTFLSYMTDRIKKSKSLLCKKET